MCYFIIDGQLNIEYVRVVALFVLQKLGLEKISCFGNSFMATEYTKHDCPPTIGRFVFVKFDRNSNRKQSNQVNNFRDIAAIVLRSGTNLAMIASVSVLCICNYKST